MQYSEVADCVAIQTCSATKRYPRRRLTGLKALECYVKKLDLKKTKLDLQFEFQKCVQVCKEILDVLFTWDWSEMSRRSMWSHNFLSRVSFQSKLFTFRHDVMVLNLLPPKIVT